MLVLGIESSCDDTAAAVVRDGVEIVSQMRHSQIDLHAAFGGIVPEIASRSHLEVIGLLIAKTLEKANLSPQEIDAIAVTAGPGLVGSLLVGLQAAKGMSAALRKPFVGVHHLCGHIYSAFLHTDKVRAKGEPVFPFLGVVVSGGHSALYRVVSWREFELLGSTRDDAAGEAFDKVAKWLGLSFPGGPVIDKLAEKGNQEAISFPRPLIHSDNFEMSFSGVKSAVMQYFRDQKLTVGDLSEQRLCDIVASFREAIVDVLICKIERAIQRFDFKQVVVAGGVAANARLRERLCNLKGEVQVLMPEPGLCTDNAAMIAGLGEQLLLRGFRSPLSLNADPQMSIFSRGSDAD